MKRLLTGIQPSGALHLGNYVGAILQVLELQKDYETFLMVADLHALTVPQDPKKYPDQVYDLAATLLACGVDPTKTVLFVQSQIPEHTALTWIFSTLTPLGELERMTQYKEKSDKHGQNAGLLTYPILQAADILLYRPEIVPVGEDQVQHLELTRVIARKFNARYGQTFSEPKTLLTKAARVMALNDPSQKMSKSILGSGVGLDDKPEQIRKAIMSAVTDTAPSKEMSAGVKNLFALLEIFAPGQVAQFQKSHASGELKYAELKTALADAIITKLEKIQQAKAQISRAELTKILASSRGRAQAIAAQTMAQVRQKVGLI